MGQQERQELAAFVNALMRRGGYPSAAAFARDAGFDATNLSRVRNGHAGIDGVNLLKLIKAVAGRAGMSVDDLAVTTVEDRLLDLTARLEVVVGQLEVRPPSQADEQGRPGV